MSTIARVCTLGLLLAVTASADTIYFKDGSSLDGVVERESEGRVTLKLPGGRMSFPMSDVLRIEDNAKKGLPKDRLVPKPEQPTVETEEEATEESAPLPPLTAEDQKTLRDMLGGLLAADQASRDATRQRIQRFGQSRDVFPFLERALPFMPDRESVEVLQLMHDLDASRAVPVLRKTAESNLDKNRATCLRLLGTMGDENGVADDEAMRLFARGMLDSSPEVQLAAAEALLKSGDRRATSVLIRGLESPDRRVQSTSLKALHHAWAASGMFDKLDSAEEWRTMLTLMDEKVRSALAAESLSPLAEAPTVGDEDYNLAVE